MKNVANERRHDVVLYGASGFVGRQTVRYIARHARLNPGLRWAIAGRSRAKLTTSTLLAVATPMHMMAPVSAGTLTVVCVTKSIQTMPARAAGRAVMMISGSSQDWKLTTISR